MDLKDNLTSFDFVEQWEDEHKIYFKTETGEIHYTNKNEIIEINLGEVHLLKQKALPGQSDKPTAKH